MSQVRLGSTLEADYTYPKVPVSQVVKTATVKTTGLGNKPVEKFVTQVISPKVRREVRAHYGCDEMEGMETEDAGSSGTVGSHWEKRLVNYSDTLLSLLFAHFFFSDEQ